jgi:hypothetical protein
VHPVDLGRVAIELGGDLLTLLHDAGRAGVGSGERLIDSRAFRNLLGANGSHRPASPDDFSYPELGSCRAPAGGSCT